jgi:hypothetical protein
MDGRQGTIEPHSGTQLFEGHIRLAAQERSQLLVMRRHNEGFTPGMAVARSDIPGAPALLQKLLDHAQGNPEAPGNFLTVSLLLVVGAEDSFTQVQGYGSHEATLA